MSSNFLLGCHLGFQDGRLTLSGGLKMKLIHNLTAKTFVPLVSYDTTLKEGRHFDLPPLLVVAPKEFVIVIDFFTLSPSWFSSTVVVSQGLLM